MIGLAAGAWLADGRAPWEPMTQATAQTSAVSTAAAPLPLSNSPAPSMSPDEQRNIHVYETANRSVVNIDT